MMAVVHHRSQAWAPDSAKCLSHRRRKKEAWQPTDQLSLPIS